MGTGHQPQARTRSAAEMFPLIQEWERTGYVLLYKHLQQGTFELPAFEAQASSCQMKWEELVLILEGVALTSVRMRKRFSWPPRRTQAPDLWAQE